MKRERVRLNVGDTIKCRDPEDMVNYMHALIEEGIETDFLYEKDGERGLWLEVTGYESKRANRAKPNDNRLRDNSQEGREPLT